MQREVPGDEGSMSLKRRDERGSRGKKGDRQSPKHEGDRQTRTACRGLEVNIEL